jgi:hypothetical protein
MADGLEVGVADLDELGFELSTVDGTPPYTVTQPSTCTTRTRTDEYATLGHPHLQACVGA